MACVEMVSVKCFVNQLSVVLCFKCVFSVYTAQLQHCMNGMLEPDSSREVGCDCRSSAIIGFHV